MLSMLFGHLQRTWRLTTPIILLIISFAFIRYAPVFPHVPYCWWKTGVHYRAHLSESYKNALTTSMNQDRQTFFAYDDRIFITLSDWLDDEDWMLNRMNQSVNYVAENSYETYPDGEIGRLYRALEEAEKKYYQNDGDISPSRDAWCALMEQVVTPK